MTRHYLLVDDNREFAENVAEILEDHGAVVDVACGGAEALGLLHPGRYDALVTDMRMPGMSGADLVQSARQKDPGLPVVLLSAYVQDAQLADARRRGLLAVMSKPGRVPQLVGMLERARRDAVVLLLEDDVALAENLAEALTARGLTVCTAQTAEELDALAVRPFVALVDLRLPDVPVGAGLARVQARFPGTPTVVITGVPDAQVPAGAELYKKPFDTAALVERLEELFAGASHRA